MSSHFTDNEAIFAALVSPPHVSSLALKIQPLSGLGNFPAPPQVSPLALHIQPLSGLANNHFVLHSIGKRYRFSLFLFSVLEFYIFYKQD